MEKIEVKVIISSPIEKIWEYFTSENHIVNRYFASEDRYCPGVTNPLKAWEIFVIKMSSKDQQNSFDFSWTYSHIDMYNSIKYTIASWYSEDGSLEYDLSKWREVEIYFEKLGDNSVEIRELFEPEEINSLELQKNWWQSILNNFKKYVENN